MRDLSIRVDAKDRTRVATWFAPGWQVRRVEPVDERAHFRGSVSISARVWAVAAALRWPAAALSAAVLAAHMFGLWSAAEVYSAEAALRSYRSGSARPAATVSAHEAAEARKHFANAEFFRQAASGVRNTGESLERAALQLEECGMMSAVPGEASISVDCRAATPVLAAAGANALATTLAERSRAEEEPPAAGDPPAAADPSPAGIESPDDGLGFPPLLRPSFHFEVVEQAEASAASKVGAWGPIAVGTILAIVALIGFAALRRRNLGSVEEVLSIFEAPVLVVDRGGSTHVS